MKQNYISPAFTTLRLLHEGYLASSSTSVNSTITNSEPAPSSPSAPIWGGAGDPSKF